MLMLCPQTRFLHHKRKKNDQAMFFLVTEESVKLAVNKCYRLLPCSSIKFFLQTATISRFQTGWKKWQNCKPVGGKSNCVLVLPFLF